MNSPLLLLLLLSPFFASENLVSRGDGFDRPIPRQPHETGSIVPSRVSLLILHTQAESGLTRGIPPDFRDDIHTKYRQPTAVGSQGAQQLISYKQSSCG